ncbi:hypothetical protein KFE98_15135 [bacterium SCSIO 12741]|nr:hypothetical protein KFE98_15135 [bacterium SCSIO 12741]
MKWWIIGILFLSLTSCKKDDPEPIDLGTDFYPIGVESVRIYDVDSIVFNDFTLTQDTYQYEVKEVIMESTVDDGGRAIVKINRYARQTGQDWKIQRVYTAHRDNFSVEEQDQNLRVVKLNFALAPGVRWDGNARNVREKEEFECVSIQSETLFGQSFSEVALIDQYHQTDPLQLYTHIATEKYARKVGLVHRYEKIIKRFTTGEPDDVPIDSGLVMEMKIKSFEVY